MCLLAALGAKDRVLGDSAAVNRGHTSFEMCKDVTETWLAETTGRGSEPTE